MLLGDILVAYWALSSDVNRLFDTFVVAGFVAPGNAERRIQITSFL